MNKAKFLACTAATAMLIGSGCATTGEDQNYRVLEEDRPILYEETGEPRSQAGPFDGRVRVVAYQGAFAVEERGEAGQPGAVAPEPKPADPYAPPQLAQFGVAVPRPNSDPSGVLRRQDWTPIVVGPAPATVEHLPTYYKDRRLGITYSDVLAQPTLAQQVEAALESGEATFTRNNFIGLAAEPLGFAIDTILLPVRMILTPPWKLVETPERRATELHNTIILEPVDDFGSEVGWRGLLGMDDLIGSEQGALTDGAEAAPGE